MPGRASYRMPPECRWNRSLVPEKVVGPAGIRANGTKDMWRKLVASAFHTQDEMDAACIRYSPSGPQPQVHPQPQLQPATSVPAPVIAVPVIPALPGANQRSALRPCHGILLALAAMCFFMAGALAVHTGSLILPEHALVVEDAVGAWRTWTSKPAAANESADALQRDNVTAEQNEADAKSLVPLSKSAPDNKTKTRRGASRNGGVSSWTIKPLLAAPITIAAVYAVARHDASVARRALATATGWLAELTGFANGAPYQEYPAADDWSLVGQEE